MSSIPHNFFTPYFGVVVLEVPGPNRGVFSHTVSVQRLPGEAIGLFVLELINVVVGSRIHVEVAGTGVTLYDAIAATETVAVSLSAYSYGSSENTLRIKVRKGSAQPKYLPFETLTTAFVGGASVFVSQVPDAIAA